MNKTERAGSSCQFSSRCQPGQCAVTPGPEPESESDQYLEMRRAGSACVTVYREAESETLFMFVGSRIRKHGMSVKLEQGHVIL